MFLKLQATFQQRLLKLSSNYLHQENYTKKYRGVEKMLGFVGFFKKM